MRCMRGVGRERTRPWVNIIQKSKAKYTGLVARRRAAPAAEAPPAPPPRGGEGDAGRGGGVWGEARGRRRRRSATTVNPDPMAPSKSNGHDGARCYRLAGRAAISGRGNGTRRSESTLCYRCAARDLSLLFPPRELDVMLDVMLDVALRTRQALLTPKCGQLSPPRSPHFARRSRKKRFSYAEPLTTICSTGTPGMV